MVPVFYVETGGESRKDSVKRRFVKNRRKLVFGVAGGLAEYFGVSPILVRAAFVVATPFSILGVVAYVILFVWMPKPPPKTSNRDCFTTRYSSS